MREVEVSEEANLAELIEMVKATHAYITKKYLILTGISLTFRERESGCERTFNIGTKSSDME